MGRVPIYTIIFYLCLYGAFEYLNMFPQILYILNRFNKLRKWLIPFHAIWLFGVYADMIVFSVFGLKQN